MDRVRLGAVPGVMPGKWLRRWAERMPDVPLELVQLEAAEVEGALRDAAPPADPPVSGSAGDPPEHPAAPHVDAALARLPIDAAGLHVVRLYEEQQVVAVAKEHPATAFPSLTLADLAGEPLLDDPSLAAADALAVVASGAAIAILPMSVVRQLGGPDVRHRIVDDLPPSTIALVWRVDRDGPVLQELAGIVRGRSARSTRGLRDGSEGAGEEPAHRSDRAHRVDGGGAATGAKPRPSKPKPTPPGSTPRRSGGPHRRGGKPGRGQGRGRS